MVLNKELRKKILERMYKDHNGHYGAVFSCLDAIKYLYDEVLSEEDTFILSKGHGAMALYAVLEERGMSPKWTDHPELDEQNGIYATTGSLGHGTPIATGRALAKKLKGSNGRTYVLLGDGEFLEGSNWEALNIANFLRVNLNVLVDWNKYQSVGSLEEYHRIDGKTLEERLKSFGFETQTINGHEIGGLRKLKKLKEGCNAIILDTIKGKGVSFIEQNHPHVYHLTKEEYDEAIKELS